jgi:uncharacterized protein YbjQ (UPF0145 family)
VSRAAESAREFLLGLSQPGNWFEYLSPGDTVWDMAIANGLQLLTIGLAGWLLATWFERRHLRTLDAREAPLRHIGVNTGKRPPHCEAEASTLLVGSVVLTHDYFRTFVIALRRLVGGNIRAYERLLARGRREALIRLKEEADLRGLDKLVNVRFNTSVVSGRFLHAVEMVAYGTGIKTQR